MSDGTETRNEPETTVAESETQPIALQQGSLLSLPNGITISRIVLIPFFVMCVLHSADSVAYEYAAGVLFIFMALSDSIDGAVARYLNERSALGAFLDPLADKLMMNTAVILLSIPGLRSGPVLPDWVPLAVISRDILIFLGFVVLYMLTGRAIIRPSWLGKVTTVIQMSMVAATLLWLVFPLAFIRSLWWLAVVVTILSGAHYIYFGCLQLHHTEQGRTGSSV